MTIMRKSQSCGGLDRLMPIALIGVSVLGTGWLMPGLALTEAEVLEQIPYQPSLELRDPSTVPDDGSIVTNATVSPVDLTIPSLWWPQDLYEGVRLESVDEDDEADPDQSDQPEQNQEESGVESDEVSEDPEEEPSEESPDQVSNPLLEHWIAYTGLDGTLKRVDLLINIQRWREYSYFERYEFVYQLGSAADEYGYVTRVFDQRQPQPRLLAAYICRDDEAATDATATSEGPDSVETVAEDLASDSQLRPTPTSAIAPTEPATDTTIDPSTASEASPDPNQETVEQPCQVYIDIAAFSVRLSPVSQPTLVVPD